MFAATLYFIYSYNKKPKGIAKTVKSLHGDLEIKELSLAINELET